ncbi:MAG TPA: hypothetical protein VEW95_11005 [Candidatus Limnocylindrales bacterium]|nr:hypothetical protein [Candidatus Limnocylindrales bacterium]
MQNVTSERRRIALQIQAVVVPFHDDAVTEDAGIRASYRLRASHLLDGLDVAVLPFPDLRAMLLAARADLGLR